MTWRAAAAASRALPRAVLLSAAAMFVSHVSAFARGLGDPAASPLEWLALAGTDAWLAVLAVCRPARFRLRTFCLPAVAVVSMAWITLVPLPATVERFRDLAPLGMVGTIAIGTAALWSLLGLLPTRLTSAPPAPPSPRRAMPFVVPLTVIGALVVLPVWIRSIPSVPLLDLLGGSSNREAVVLGRQAAFREIDSAPLRLVIGVLRNFYLLFAAGWLTSDWLANRRDRPERANRSLVLLVVTLAVAATFALLTTEKSIVGQLVLVVAVAGLTISDRTLTWRTMGVLGVAGVAFPLAYFATVGSGSPGARIGGAVAGVRRRIFFLPDEVLLHYFSAFPRLRPHLDGASIPKLGKVLTGEGFDLSGYIYDTFYLRPGGIRGNANGSFLGVGWANFGAAGVVVWCVLAGVAIVAVEGFLRRCSPRSSAALRGLFVVQVVFLTQVDVFRSVLAIAPGALDVVVLVWLSERVLRRSVPTRRRERRVLEAVP